eukprot:7920882-Pyramimonas_sp.AAC.1
MRARTSPQFSTVWFYPKKKKEVTKEPPANRRIILHNLSLWGAKVLQIRQQTLSSLQNHTSSRMARMTFLFFGFEQICWS